MTMRKIKRKFTQSTKPKHWTLSYLIKQPIESPMGNSEWLQIKQYFNCFYLTKINTSALPEGTLVYNPTLTLEK